MRREIGEPRPTDALHACRCRLHALIEEIEQPVVLQTMLALGEYALGRVAGWHPCISVLTGMVGLMGCCWMA